MNKQYIIERLKEPSTWRGIAMICAAFGIVISPEQIGTILTVAFTIIGAIGAGMPDKQ